MAQIIIFNPLNSEIPAAYINLTVNASLDILLLDDFLLTGRTQNMNYTVTSFQALFQTPETIDNIKNRVNGIKNIILEAMDISLQKGVHLPVPALVKTNIGSSTLSTYDGYLLVEADNMHGNAQTLANLLL